MHLDLSPRPSSEAHGDAKCGPAPGQSKRERLGQPTRAGVDKSTQGGKDLRPLGYTITVSTLEGVFENETKHAAKNGAYAHTNMTQAAINMIAQPEASIVWKTRPGGEYRSRVHVCCA